jgi:hypothetical protein
MFERKFYNPKVFIESKFGKLLENGTIGFN